MARHRSQIEQVSAGLMPGAGCAWVGGENIQHSTFNIQHPITWRQLYAPHAPAPALALAPKNLPPAEPRLFRNAVVGLLKNFQRLLDKMSAAWVEVTFFEQEQEQEHEHEARHHAARSIECWMLNVECWMFPSTQPAAVPSP